MRHWFLWFMLVGTIGSLSAQYSGMSIARWSMENGLPDNYILGIAQDDRGFLWLGTKEGISRFDGRQFRNYYPNEVDSSGLRYNAVHSLLAHRNGRMLFVNAGELMAFHTQTHRFERVYSRPDLTVIGLGQRKDGGLFLYCQNQVLVLDSQCQVVDSLRLPVDTKGMRLNAYELEDSLWLLSTELHHYLYDTRTRSFSLLPLSKEMPAYQALTAFQYYDPKARLLYFGNYWRGLMVYDLLGRQHNRFYAGEGKKELSANHISFVVPQNDSILMVGTYEGGLNILNLHTDKTNVLRYRTGKMQGLSSNNLVSCLMDPAGQVWIGTDRGLCRLNNLNGKVQWWDLSPGHITQTLQDNRGNTYAGIFNTKKLVRIRSRQEMDTLMSTSLPPVWALGQVGQEMAILGGSMQVTLFNPESKKIRQTPSLREFFRQSDLLLLARQDSRGDQWYSGNAGGGLLRWEAASGQWKHYSNQQQPAAFSQGYFNVCAEDARGNMWFGVNKYNRLVRWERSANRFSEIPLETLPGLNGQRFSGVNAMIADDKNQLWIGTDGTGLICLNLESNKARQYTLAHGLPSDFIFSLTIDAHDRIWVATMKGLGAMQPGQNRFRRFSTAQGIPFLEFEDNNASYDKFNNRVWVGSRAHLVSFNPDSLWMDHAAPQQVFIDEVKVNGSSLLLPATGSLALQAGQNNIQVRFAVPDLVNETAVEYEYRLGGLNESWVRNGTLDEASFVALPPGTYTLQVRARHKGDESWVVMNFPFEFSIATPWYQTGAFIVCMAGLIILLLALAIRWYLRQHFERQRMHMEMELAVSEERNRLARELHDGLGSMLSGIKHSLVAVQQQVREPLLQQGLQNSVGHLDTSISELRNISHSMASVTAQGGLVETLHAYCQQLQGAGNMTVSFESLLPEDFVIQDEPAFHLFRIVQELLQNILKHSEASNVIVQLSQNEGQVYVTVEDDGKGFVYAEALRGSGMGLRNILQRVKVLNGKTDFRTAPGEGCSVVIEVPVA
jgi:signal transduction histidine kinase/streptogramin lyase